MKRIFLFLLCQGSLDSFCQVADTTYGHMSDGTRYSVVTMHKVDTILVRKNCKSVRMSCRECIIRFS